jgi:hypothetical protein
MATSGKDAPLFPEHTLNLRHLIMAHRITFSIVPSNGDFTPRRSDNRTKVSCLRSPANTVAGFEASGLIASHFGFFGVISVRSRQMSHRELNLTVGKLPPVFNDSRVSGLRKLTEDFACFQAGGFNW